MIVFITNNIRRYGMMQVALERFQTATGDADSSCHWVDHETMWSDEWHARFERATAVVVKWMGATIDTPFFREMLAILDKKGTSYLIDAAGSKEDKRVHGFTDDQVRTYINYASFGGDTNYENSWHYIQGILDGNTDDVPMPDPMYWAGIYHPRAKQVYTDFDSYWQDYGKPGVPVIGLLFYRDEWVWGDLTYQAAFVEAVETAGMVPVCVFSNGMPNPELGMPTLSEVFTTFFTHEGIASIDCLVNTLKFSLTNRGYFTTDWLKTWDVPILQAYNLLVTYEDWVDAGEGMNAMEVSISVALPEFDGVVHSVPLANKNVLENGDVRYLPIADRLQAIVNQVKRMAALRRCERADRKVAIIFHNYPPRNSNIGSAVGLDTMESVRRLLQVLRDREYQVDTVPETSEELVTLLTTHATNDIDLLTEGQWEQAKRLSAVDYRRFFQSLPTRVQKEMTAAWGEAPGEVMVIDDDILVPGIANGNVFITMQPPRGFGEDPSKIYHSPSTPPTHQYLAFYQWLRQDWQAHAVVHVGTHGSLEWLPGKNAGLSASCYPDIALGGVPNVYPYHMTITGEGIQAKRRSNACLIAHLPAPQEQAGLYDELEELEQIMDEYLHFAHTQPEQLERLEPLVLAQVEKANLQNEVNPADYAEFHDFVMALHEYLTELKHLEVHTGLHILGQAPTGDLLTQYMWLLTRLPNGDTPSLVESIARQYGYVYADLFKDSGAWLADMQCNKGQLLQRIHEDALALIRQLAASGFTEAGIPDTVSAEVHAVLTYIIYTVYPKLQETTAETTNLLHALAGDYVEPGPSGAPSSGGVDLLPTGRNFYGVDPRTLPTPAAWEIGKALGDDVLARYMAEEGRYPESIGIVLWSGANMRSHGQCLAEIFYLLGVQPVWQAGSRRLIDLKVIPLEELGRPRIDVTSRASGLFRDTMAGAMEWLDKATLLVAGLDEPLEQNFVRKHVLAESEELVATGLSPEDAWREASFRVFSDEWGTYGAGVNALLENRNWEHIDDLADVYVRWGGFAYGSGANGVYRPERFRARMGTLDVTIKNEDNRETNMLSCDDYNAYHGGMIAAVRSIRGTVPCSYCGDSTDRRRVTMHSVQEEMKRVFRSEAINPKFIAGMMKHGYKGAADMANTLAHSYQWDATSDVMEDWMYEAYAKSYAFDPKVQDWMREVNPWAMQRLVSILLEASQRGLWQASEETLDRLKALYREMEGEVEGCGDD